MLPHAMGGSTMLSGWHVWMVVDHGVYLLTVLTAWVSYTYYAKLGNPTMRLPDYVAGPTASGYCIS